MAATPLFRKKEVRDGFIQELVVWRLDKPVTGCRHLFKYRFYFGRDDGTCLVRYDNERGKGDHKHFMGKELPYIFRTLEAVFSDFAQTSILFWMGAASHEKFENRNKELG